ncbi:MAG: YdcF family protein [Thermomicrobiales bacterium]
MWRWIGIGSAIIVIGIFLIPFLVFASVYRQSRVNEARPADAIVVLGAAQFNGIPSQVFQGTARHSIRPVSAGIRPLIVVTGGRILGDQYTEAEAGKTYLVDRGVPADAILMENVSHNTAASFEGVRRILAPRGIENAAPRQRRVPPLPLQDAGRERGIHRLWRCVRAEPH